MIVGWILLLAVSASDTAPFEPARRVAVSSQITLKVSDPEATADRVVELAEARGGYLHLLDGRSVRVKVPVAQLEALRAEVAAAGVVIGRSDRADDVGQAIDRLVTRVASRRKVLDQYLTLLERAPVQAVVTVEREVMQLVGEIERMEGELRVLLHRETFAELQVDFRAPDRRPPAPLGSSPFPWVNSVTLSNLEEGFRDAR